ncbi:MAG: Pr6Pr family membrane protein [Chitinophagaceae bacterium]|jgi:hypothetical protein|nr:Pr6Pr family membrane protein [Chitinophagaceae bacterium]
MNTIYKRNLSLIFAIIVWFAILAQFYLIIENRVAPVPETIIRFFSFFTILTNILVAVYFTMNALGRNQFDKAGKLTAITIYITIVGLVYQLLLRHIWQPTGLQMVVDELLHSVNPLLVLIYWYLFEMKTSIKYKQIFGWMVFPIVYLVYILIRGNFSGFYPYPFINVSEIGISKALVNGLILLLFFYAVSAFFIFLGRILNKRNNPEVITSS